MAMPSGRYFGFVIGGALPAALAADWLTSTWDQNAGLIGSARAPASSRRSRLEWLRELLGSPRRVGRLRHRLPDGARDRARRGAPPRPRARGLGLLRDGLQGAPRIRVLAGEERHVTVDRALRYLGIGRRRSSVAADEQGRMRADALRAALAKADGPTIVCAQAGNVNSGSFDPLDEIADAVEGAGAWLHVDGAFGLWAAASPRLRHLVAGSERADSWATDAHKWLNVPYDSASRSAPTGGTRAAMAVRASYLEQATLTRPATRSTGSRSSPAALAASRSMPRFARSGAKGSPRWSSAAATTRAASRSYSARSPGSRSSTTSCSTRCSSGSATTTRHARRGRRGARGRHLLALGHRLAGEGRDAHLRLELADDDRGCRRSADAILEGPPR